MADKNENISEEEVVEESSSAKAPKEKKTAKEKKPGFFARLFGKIGKFCRDSVSEMKKVVWLSGKETTRSSVVVVVVVVVLSIVIGLVDTGLAYGLTGLRNLGSFLR